MVARLHHRAHRRNRSHPAAKRMRARPPFQRAKVLLQRIPRRIGQPSILMPFIFSNRLLLIRRGQINRHIHRSSQLIRSLPIMNRPRRKSQLLSLSHRAPVFLTSLSTPYSLHPTPCLNPASLCSDTAPPNPESPSPLSSPLPAPSPHPPPRTTSPRHSIPQRHPPPQPVASPSPSLDHPLPSSRGRTHCDQTSQE